MIGMYGKFVFARGARRSDAMKIERIVLRLLRMPLVHFFETSFSRTYERHIVIVEVVSRGAFGLGRDHGGRASFL